MHGPFVEALDAREDENLTGMLASTRTTRAPWAMHPGSKEAMAGRGPAKTLQSRSGVTWGEEPRLAGWLAGEGIGKEEG